MPLTCSIPILDCYVRAAYLFDSPGDPVLQQVGVHAYADTVTSVDSRGLLWNVQLANGARFDRLPLTALWTGYAEPCEAPALPLGTLATFRLPRAPRLVELCEWNAMSANVELHSRPMMEGQAIMYWHRDPKTGDVTRHEPCQYLGTFDWHITANVPSEGGHHGHKCAHWLIRPDGHVALQPNNRIGVLQASEGTDAAFWRSEKPFRPSVRNWPDAFTSTEFLDLTAPVE